MKATMAKLAEVARQLGVGDQVACRRLDADDLIRLEP